MHMIVVYKKTDDAHEEEMVEASSVMFNRMVNAHAARTLNVDNYQSWCAMSKADSQVRRLLLEDFSQLWPGLLEGYNVVCFGYHAARFSELPPLTMFTFLGDEFYGELSDRSEMFAYQLRKWVEADCNDDEYRQLRRVAAKYPYLAAACMPMAMTYFQCGGLPNPVSRYWSLANKAASFSAPTRGKFFGMLEDACDEGLAIWRRGALKVVAKGEVNAQD